MWGLLAKYVYEHGEAFYNFQGVRAYKEKFLPSGSRAIWRTRADLRCARALADVSALIAGGYRRIFFKAA